MKLARRLAAALLRSSAPAAELELVQTIPLKGKPGNLDHLALDAKRDRLLVANKANNTLDVVDLKAGTCSSRCPTRPASRGSPTRPTWTGCSSAWGPTACATCSTARRYKAVKTIKFADDCDNVRYNPKTQLVYVAHAEQSLGVISAKTNALKADIKLPAAAEAFVSRGRAGRGRTSPPRARAR